MRGFFLGLAGMLLLLSGCLVPEKFTIVYELNSNGDYSYKYDGTMVNALSRMSSLEAAQKGKTLSASKAGEEAKAMAEQFKADPRVTDFKEIGNDTYKIKMEEKGNIKEKGSSTFLDKDLNYWTLKYNAKDNTVTLAVPPIKNKDLEEVKIKLDGEFKISTNCEIVSASAKLDKSFFGNTRSFKINNNSTEGVTVLMNLK